jgi:hypothetical protein
MRARHPLYLTPKNCAGSSIGGIWHECVEIRIRSTARAAYMASQVHLVASILRRTGYHGRKAEGGRRNSIRTATARERQGTRGGARSWFASGANRCCLESAWTAPGARAQEHAAPGDTRLSPPAESRKTRSQTGPPGRLTGEFLRLAICLRSVTPEGFLALSCATDRRSV